jgi:hypothetical protein
MGLAHPVTSGRRRVHGMDKQTDIERTKYCRRSTKINNYAQTDKITRVALRAAIQRIKNINDSRLGWDTHTPKPEGLVPEFGMGAAPASGAQALGRSAERPAAHHPKHSRTGTQGINKYPRSIIAEPVPCPLPDIPVHIIQPKRVRSLLSHCMYLS